MATHTQRLFGNARVGSTFINDTAWPVAKSCLRLLARVIAQALIGNRAITIKTTIHRIFVQTPPKDPVWSE